MLTEYKLCEQMVWRCSHVAFFLEFCDYIFFPFILNSDFSSSNSMEVFTE